MSFLTRIFDVIFDFFKKLFRTPPKENMAYESSLNYRVWATSWSIPAQGLGAYPAFVPLMRPPDAIANTARQPTDLTGLSIPAWDYFYNLVQQIPRTRRVYHGHYWQDDGMNIYKFNIDYYKLRKDGTTYGDQQGEIISGFGDANPLKFSSPWGFTSGADGKTSLKAFLQKCITFGVTFDYYWDDSESHLHYQLGSNYNAYSGGFDANGLPINIPSYFSLPDPRRTAAIVKDYRFNNLNFLNINDRTFAQEFIQKYKDITNNQSESRTYLELLSFYTTITSRQDFSIPWGTEHIPAMYAFDSTLFTYNFGTVRTRTIYAAFQEMSLANRTKRFQTDLYPVNKDEAQYVTDLNSHYMIRDDIPLYDYCCHLYGDVSQNVIDFYGYTRNPTTDYERYAIVYGGVPLGTPAYHAFLKEMRKLRGMCRTNSASFQKLTAVISSPYYSGEERKLYTDPRYWYELMYHACLHGVGFFNAFIKENETTGFAEIQQFLDEWKTVSSNIGGVPVSNAHGTMAELADRIDLAEAVTVGVVSGMWFVSQNKWLWRLTAAPDVTRYARNDPTQTDLPAFIEIPPESRGVWLVRNSPDRPNYIPTPASPNNITVTANVPIIQTPEVVSKSPLSKSPFNSRLSNTISDLSPNAPFEPASKANEASIADYSVPYDPKNRIFMQILLCVHATNSWDGWLDGTVATYQGNRINSPWPNDGYTTRAYPWEFNPTNPDVSSPWHNIIYEHTIEAYRWGARSFFFWMPFGGLYSGSFITPEIWKRTFTSTTDPKRCPARWKGFTQAIRSLLEGTMTPNGKDPIDKGCNVSFYLPANRGDFPYVTRSSAYWQTLGTTDTQRDQKYYEHLDAMIADIVSMKGRTPTSGKLSVQIDTIVGSATPNTLPVFRSSVNYKTDALELSDWYVYNKLRANGIPVYCEARNPRTLYDENAGVELTNEFAKNPATCGYYWSLFSDPRYNSCCDFGTDEEVRTIFIQDDANFPVSLPGIDYFKPRTKSTYNGRTRTLIWGNGIHYSTPHFFVWRLYFLSENYRYFYNKGNPTDPMKGVKSSLDNFLAIPAVAFMNHNSTLETYDGIHDPQMTYWRLPANLINYRPLLDTTAFMAAQPIDSYQGGLWSDAGKTYWDTNVTQTSFNNLITFVDTFSRGYSPESPDWGGVTYGNDPVALNTIYYV